MDSKTFRSSALLLPSCSQEPLNFVVANEDHNLYTFDMRKLNTAKLIHKDHVGAVMDVAFSPTGQEFVSGSYDKTVRIFRHRDGRSREVYHTKRMQRVFCVNFSGDGRFVLSGSDDTNLRIWKAEVRDAQPQNRYSLAVRGAGKCNECSFCGCLYVLENE